MGTTRDKIEEWLNEAKNLGATHVIVVCDRFSYDDYAVYVFPNKDSVKEEAGFVSDNAIGTVEEVYKRFEGKNMQKVMEVYSLSRDIESQLDECVAFHFD